MDFSRFFFFFFGGGESDESESDDESELDDDSDSDEVSDSDSDDEEWDRDFLGFSSFPIFLPLAAECGSGMPSMPVVFGCGCSSEPNADPPIMLANDSHSASSWELWVPVSFYQERRKY